jgi:hypothetical protein
MPFRIDNLSRQLVLGGGASSENKSLVIQVPLHYKTINEAVKVAGPRPASIIEVHTGIYEENVTLEDNVSIVGIGMVMLKGKMILHGNGFIRDLYLDHLQISDATRSVEGCQIDQTLQIEKSHVTFRNIEIQCSLIARFATIVLRQSCIFSEDYSLELTQSTLYADDCDLQGEIKMEDTSIATLKESSIVSVHDVDLIVVEDEKSTIQLFNCYVTAKTRVKSGPGNSIRANLIALGSATEMVGGENIKLESI